MTATPKFNEGDSVETVEGISGTIAGPGEWSDDEEAFEYYVEWEDGKATTELESFFKGAWD